MRSRFSQVTHYYFRDCAYYTPMYSDPFYGSIFFREMTDIATGEAIPNTVSGYKVPQWFIGFGPYDGPKLAIATVYEEKPGLLGSQDAGAASRAVFAAKFGGTP